MIINKKPEGLENPKDQKQGSNCGVTACAIATGISFQKSWDLHKEIGKKSNKWKGSTFNGERKKVLHKLKVDFKSTRFYTKQVIKENVIKNYELSFSAYPISLKNYVKRNCNGLSTYIIETTKHVQVVKGGWVIDQRGAKPIDDFWARNHKVTDVIEMLPKKNKEK